MNEKAYTKKMRGFLITEVILSLFVLTIGLTTTIALISTSLRQSFDNRDTIIAVELAQEGVELVRNVRDNGFIKNSADPFEKFPNSGHRNCHISYDDSYAGMNCTAPLQVNDYILNYSVGGYYTHNGGAATKFSRYVYIYYVASDKTWTVKSFVYWGGLFTPPSGGSTASCTVAKKCVFTEITLTNWR